MLKIDNEQLVFELSDTLSYVTIFDLKGNCLVNRYCLNEQKQISLLGLDQLLVIIENQITNVSIYRLNAISKSIVSLANK